MSPPNDPTKLSRMSCAIAAGDVSIVHRHRAVQMNDHSSLRRKSSSSKTWRCAAPAI